MTAPEEFSLEERALLADVVWDAIERLDYKLNDFYEQQVYEEEDNEAMRDKKARLAILYERL